ncbi:MAG: tyrosine-type recombinase/integrase [Actinomycetota bacterium]
MKSFRKEKDAKLHLAKQLLDIERGEWIDPKVGRTRFAVYAAGWFASTSHLAPGTRLNVEGRLRNHIIPAFGEAPMSAIRPEHVREWVAHLQSRGLAPATLIAAYRVFAKIMRTAEVDRVITRSPCIGIDLPRDTAHQEMRFLDPDEIGRLADEIADRYSAMIVMAAYTGLRWGELVALKVDRLNLLRGSVDVRESMAEINGHLHVGSTKTGARRSVSLPKFLMRILSEHIGNYPSPQSFVFSAAEGGPLRRTFYRRHFKPAVARAGLDPGLRFHDLRHTCASLLIAQGAHPKEIQERLGHSTIRLTFDRYGHLLPSLDERLRDGLEEAFQTAQSAPRVGNPWEIGGLREAKSPSRGGQ